MEVIPDIIETVEGRNVTIMCNVTANPKPGGIIWKKSDGILSSARTFVREGNITILNVTTQDNGSYVCTATNPCSQNHRQFSFVSIQLSSLSSSLHRM